MRKLTVEEELDEIFKDYDQWKDKAQAEKDCPRRDLWQPIDDEAGRLALAEQEGRE